jgi:hypothetical protein
LLKKRGSSKFPTNQEVHAALHEKDLYNTQTKNRSYFFELLEFKINQILLQVHAKNPNFQKEILNIKKMMQDFQVKFQKKE